MSGVALAVAILALAWIWLALDHGTVRLWNVVVHESGDHTLGDTVLHFGHFLREVPMLIAIALFVIAAFGAPRPGGSGSQGERRMLAIGASAVGTAAVLVGLALFVVARNRGFDDALRDLVQFRTRDDLAAYGSHWRFHLLSTIWLGVTASLAVRAWARRAGGPAPADPQGSRALRIAAWAWFIGLTVIFVPTAEPFVDPRFIGHQAREILTHGLVTLPLALGTFSIVWRDERPDRPTPATTAIPLVAVAVFVLIPLYLAVATVIMDSMSTAQADLGLSAMVAAHFLEHTLDYLFVVLACVGGAGLVGRWSARG